MTQSSISKNILIIDDDPIARMLAKRNLEIAGFKGSITTADNGEVGFDIIKNTRQNYIVLLDFHMPELDGIGLLKRLNSHNIELPVFMLSSSILSENQNQCLSFPWVQDFFVKPIDQIKTKAILEFANSYVTA
ncbi:MAG: response regulator [Salibacteraceae bacterium]